MTPDLQKIVEDAFRAGFEAGADFADCREGKYRPVEDVPGDDAAWSAYAAQHLNGEN